MAEYCAPLCDMAFVIEQWLQAPQAWARSTAFADVDEQLAAQVLEEGAKFAVQVLAPLNTTGDREGCRLVAGAVVTPTGFAAAYAQYVQNGWPAMACAVEDGGQGLPMLLAAAFQEMQFSANHGWAMYTGIAHGAYECLRAHGAAWMRERYLPQLVSGEVLPTMCLTEPQAGSDVGLLRTRAHPHADGSYRLSGNKLFISGAEHDFTENILHLVLARLPDAPAGSKGISLFLVPKWLDVAGGVERNAVHCVGLEHKMGIHGSPTCSVAFEEATGWLVGDAHAGLAAMFVMMNSARLHVGLQGLGHGEFALQQASAYAAERRQMRAVTRPDGAATAPADPIAYHPTVRRTLLQMRAFSEGMRVIGYWAAHLLDGAEQAEGAERKQLQARAGLLTPVIKAFFSEQGFQLASQAVQVFGGYGYVLDYGVEQTLRDSRIVMIYEGSNEVQANDLLVRKVLGDGGTNLDDLLAVVRLEAQQVTDYGPRLLALCDAVQAAVAGLVDSQDAERPYRVAGDFLRVIGLVLLGHAWARTARLAADQQAPFYQRKRETARFYFDYLLPEADYRLALIAGSVSPLPFV